MLDSFEPNTLLPVDYDLQPSWNGLVESEGCVRIVVASDRHLMMLRLDAWRVHEDDVGAG